MQMTDQALRALVRAAEVAHNRGEKPVTSFHLLLGLADSDGGARHGLGLSADRLADAGLSFATAREVVDNVLGPARAAGRDRATTADILAAAIGAPDSPVAAVLRTAGADPEAVRAALTEGDHGPCCQESGVSDLRPILAELGSPEADLPGRLWTVARLVGTSIPFLLLWLAVLVVTWDTSGPELVLVFGVGSMLLSVPAGWIKVRRRVRAALAQIPLALAVPGAAGPLLSRLGLRRLEVRVEAGIVQDRCYRLGRQAWIVVGEHTERHPEWSRFVLWHELGHLARRDHTAWRLSGALAGSLVVAALASLDVRALAIAVLGGAALMIGGRWWSELACDRFAVRRTGPGGLHAWAADQRDTWHRSGTRWVPAGSSLTHPPLALRTAGQR